MTKQARLESKKCDQCPDIKPLVNFPFVQGADDGHGDTCRACINSASQSKESRSMEIMRFKRNRCVKHQEAKALWDDINYLRSIKL